MNLTKTISPLPGFDTALVSSIPRKCFLWLQLLECSSEMIANGAAGRLQWEQTHLGGRLQWTGDADEFSICWEGSWAAPAAIAGTDHRFREPSQNLESFTDIEQKVYAEIEQLAQSRSVL